jgi:hypothetical protein
MAARAKRNPTSNPPKIGPPKWLSLEEVFQRWRARLGSSEEAKDELYNLLCSRDCRSLIKHVDADGNEAYDGLDYQFWRNTAHLVVTWDVADGVDHIAVTYALLDGTTEFLVLAESVERWVLPPIAAPLPPPPADQPAPDLEPKGEADIDPVEAETKADNSPSVEQPPQESPKGEDKLEEKAAPDSSKAEGTGRPTAKPRSKLQQLLRDAADETFPNGWGHLPTGTIIKQAGEHREVKALKREPGYDTWQRAFGRRVD